MSSLIEYESNEPFDPDPRALGEDAEAGGRQVNLLELAWRAKWLVLLTMLVGAGIAWGLLQRAEPRYKARSRIYVKQNLPRILSSDAQVRHAASYLYTQAELIRSSQVLSAAANAPENAELESFRGVDSRVGLLSKAIEVKVGQNDDIINVFMELPNSDDAAQIVNSVVDAYKAMYAEEHRTGTVEILNILRGEKKRRDTELTQHREDLDRFRNDNAELAVQVGQENVITKRFAALASELDRTELMLLDARTRHNRTQQMVETPSQRPYLLELAQSRQLAASDIRLENQLELGLERQLLDIDLRIASERATWGDGHPRVKLLLDSRAKTEERLAKQQAATEERKQMIIAAYVESVSQEFELLEQKRIELQRNYDEQFKLAMQVNTQAQKLAMLQESLARAVRQADLLDDQIKKLNLSEGVGAMQVRIIDVALPAAEPSYPIPARFLGIGLLLGGITGFGLAWLRQLLDRRLRSIEEMEGALGLPVLGALPLSAGLGDRVEVGKILLNQPRSVTAEAFRTLRTAIHFGTTSQESKAIAVTSPLPEEGKSVVASNLAIALAQLGQKVLLIDADLRKPSQHEIFGVEAEEGLSTVLSERLSPDEAIRPTIVPTLDLLPSGRPVANPVELLNNGYFDDLLDDLRGIYDRIVIDSPALLPVADARIVAALSDSVLLVLRAESSTREDSQAARDMLWQVGVRQLGVVVNLVPESSRNRYGYHGAGDRGYYETRLPIEAPEKKSTSTLIGVEP